MPRASGRSLLCVAVAVSLLGAIAPATAQTTGAELTQPVHSFAEAIRERVFVFGNFDSDGDGEPDAIAMDIVRPQASEDGLKVPVIMDASPYYSTLGRGNEAERKQDVDGDGPLDPCGRRGVRERPVVGLADHPGVPVVPVGGHGVARGVEPVPAPVEPIDGHDRAAVVRRATRDRATARVVGADHVEQDDRIAARDEVVVAEQREQIKGPVVVDVLLALGLVAAPEGGVVRARVHDHGDLQPVLGRLWPHDVHRDRVRLAVAVAVEVAEHEHPLADRLGA